MPPPGRRYFNNQRYSVLKKQCEKKKQLFVDTEFTPTNTSLFLEQGRSSDIVWKRPAEIVPDPHLFVEGASPNDVTQGILGNCWFVSACSALTHNTDLLEKVIPYANKQEWAPENVYSGIFRFRFWRFGRWMEVVVDDLLPTRDGKLLFARSKTPNEFWSALLEKAFAKLYGCYENLVGGHLSDALQDVSGGVAETISVVKFVRNDPIGRSSELFERLRMAFENEALVVAAIAAKTKEEIEESLECGLVKGHAYAVTAVRFIELDAKNGPISGIFRKNEQQRMIRLQNPWGEKEWNGPWSDLSREWEQVTAAQKKTLGITVEEDGEFWMPWESFMQYFTDISICQLFNTSVFSLQKTYDEKVFFGAWSSNGARSGAPDDKAGGCLNFPATFCNNPQYIFDVNDEQNEVMFALTQREVGEGQKRREPFVCIGMHIMRVEANRQHRLHQPNEAVETSDYANSRSVFLHLINLRPGRYVLLPTTYAPREQSTFMLRAYSSETLHMKELKKHSPHIGLCWQPATYVTRIQLKDAELATTSEMNVYCILKTEKCSYRSRTLRNTIRPNWDEQFVFFKRSARQQYVLEMWEDRRMSKDRLVAKILLTAMTDNDSRDESHEFAEGKLRVRISAYDDPMYL